MDVNEENTWRALQDKTPLVESRWCQWGFHKWTKWVTLQEEKVFVAVYLGSRLHQRRECVSCGDVEGRILTIKGQRE